MNIDYFYYFQSVSPQKETTATTKVGLSLLVEVQTKLYYGMKTMVRKFRKYGKVENIVVHQKNTPTYYVKYSFKGEGKQEIIKKGKHQDGFSVPSRTEK